MQIEIPEDVRAYVKNHFASCNFGVSTDLSTFPAIHEESLDMNLVAYFSRHQQPVKLSSDWIVRIDAHFIGGGRHFGTWEVADIGLMMVFRRHHKVVKSKLAMLQSKKLYSRPLVYDPEDPYIRRYGLGRLLVTDEEHENLIRDCTLSFDENSKYHAFKKDSDQQETMSRFEERFDMKMYYLFYNPVVIPHRIKMPLESEPRFDTNDVGCRVVPKVALDDALIRKEPGHIPSYGEIKFLLGDEFLEDVNSGGWRLEHFAGDLMLDCKEGMVDDSPNFEQMVRLMNSKTRPMSSAISITFDIL